MRRVWPLIAVCRMPCSLAGIAPLYGRLILIAYSERKQPDQHQTVENSGKQEGQTEAEDLEAGLILLAIVGISDPLRAEVVDAVQQCNRAGITVRMLTGQSPPPPKLACHLLLCTIFQWQMVPCIATLA